MTPILITGISTRGKVKLATELAARISDESKTVVLTHASIYKDPLKRKDLDNIKVIIVEDLRNVPDVCATIGYLNKELKKRDPMIILVTNNYDYTSVPGTNTLHCSN